MANRIRLVSTSVSELNRAIGEAAKAKQTPISLATLLSFGRRAAVDGIGDTLNTSAHFLKRELPIRFAHRVMELDSLPHNLANMPSIRRVCDWYKESFAEIRECPNPHTSVDEARFSALLDSIYQRHSGTIIQIARGIFEFRKSLGVPYGHAMPSHIEDTVMSFLDTFFTSRMGIRTLISQHLAMHQPSAFYVGIINTQCRPAAVIEDAIADSRLLCERNFGEAPEVEIIGSKDFVFAYVPPYIHHIVFELVKNSMRAVVEQHGGKGGAAGGRLPPIRIILSASGDSEDVIIKVLMCFSH